ncbi:hypothetical protein BDZ91DRAFT_816733 [Kalaharituber pfeilii]|nr:hypothetical protein BDZ91DRAFT_816733 [Kalaharituber pfeilii]
MSSRSQSLSSGEKHSLQDVYPTNSNSPTATEEQDDDCSPRGSISLASQLASDDHLLPKQSSATSKRKPGSGNRGARTMASPKSPQGRTVHFAEKDFIADYHNPPPPAPLRKSQRARIAAKSTLDVVKCVAAGALGCVCFIFYKACILDSSSGMGTGSSRVMVARESGDGTRRVRVVPQMDDYGYSRRASDPTHSAHRQRAQVPSAVRRAQTAGNTKRRSAVEVAAAPVGGRRYR